MPAFQLVPHPQFTPTACVTCGANRDPDGFVDLLVESATQGFNELDGSPIHAADGVTPTIGHLYLCCSCLYQAANAAGCLTPQQRVEHQDRLADASAEIDRLQVELDGERRTKLVDLEQLAELVQQAAKPRPRPRQAA